MLFLLFVLCFSLPTFVIFGVQYLFCQCKYKAVKLIPTIAALGLLIWYAVAQSQLPEEPRGCSTGAGITVFFVGGIFVSLFVGITVAWLVYLNNAGSKEKEKDESEE